MKLLYITDSKKVAETIAELNQCSYHPESNCFIGSSCYVLYIKAKFNIQLNGTGRKLLEFDDGFETISVTVEYLTFNDIKSVKAILSKDPELRIINVCTASPRGQLNYEILMKCLSLKTDDTYRIWLNTNKFDIDQLKSHKSNNLFKYESDAKLAEIIIDQYWAFRSKKIFGSETDINIKEMLVLSLLENKELELKTDDSRDREYYRIAVRLDDKVFILNNKIKGDKIASIDEARELSNEIKEQEMLISKIETKRYIKEHPLLYNTSDLYSDIQKSKLLEIDEVNKVFEKLYNQGYITNPYTESRHLPTTMTKEIFDILKALKGAPQYTDYIEYLKVTNDSINITRRIMNDSLVDNSHAIIPTVQIPLNHNLDSREYGVYDLVVRRFLASFTGDLITEKTIINAIIDKNNIAKYESESIIKRGWTVLYDKKLDIIDEVNTIKQNPTKENEDSINLNSLEKYDISAVNILTGNPRGKSRYTLASLINLMSNLGKKVKDANLKAKMRHLSIGMPGDRNIIIDSLINKNYIYLDDENKVYISPEAVDLLSKTPKDLLSLQLLETFNMRIKSIQQGQLNIKEVIREHTSYLTKIIEDKYNINDQFRIIDYSTILENLQCPFCPNGLADKGKFIGCKGYPSCEFTIPKVYKQYTLNERDIIQLVSEGITGWITGFTFSKGPVRKGKAMLKINENRKVIPWFEE